MRRPMVPLYFVRPLPRAEQIAMHPFSKNSKLSLRVGNTALIQLYIFLGTRRAWSLKVNCIK